MYRKIRSNIKIYHDDITRKGLKYFFTARILKFDTTRSIYNLFRPHKVTVNGHIVYVDKNDTIISHELLTHKMWDPYCTKVFSEIVKKDWTVLDIGAHIGYYSLLASSLVGNKGRVYSFEPDPHNFSLLQKNILENNIHNVELINKAVGEKKRKVTFHVNTRNTGDNRIFDNGQLRKEIKVQQIAIDEFLPKIPVDFIKIDIQGSEMKAMLGMKKLLTMNRNIIILTELWPEGLEMSNSSISEYLTFLEKRHFYFYLVSEEKKEISLTSKKDLLEEYALQKLYDTNLVCTRKKLSPSLLKKLNSL